ncbi:hypothetical protein K7X08_015352 [Anisodus acutangulus]|uniref:Pentatricopeptide repeat-containing protein n=1 Tax=Anisodus acutangulus TaxID=402998 RepID=A0A9Q1L396_9SOLA|nr:hypothetical protein K7X08_015352 [Anisodus acutangulus]
MIHGHVFKVGLMNDVYVHASLIITCAQNGEMDDARVDDARELFAEMPVRDVSWNAMILAYAQMARFEEALVLFEEMRNVNVTFGALDLGKWIHAYFDKHYQHLQNTSLWTTLINMYAKCGAIAAAKQVFQGMKTKTLASYNVMISGLAMHGDAHEALELFRKMTEEGMKPDDITFVSVLTACNHAGLVDLGHENFNTMIQSYKYTPKLQHYGCMIDLLGRAGKFDEAMAMIESMEIKPDGAILGSLLGSCKILKNVELGEYAAKNLFELEPENPGAYVLLSNIYAGAGEWDKVALIRTLNDQGMKKVPSCTSIEIDRVVHEFLVSDIKHPQINKIYKMLEPCSRYI